MELERSIRCHVEVFFSSALLVKRGFPDNKVCLELVKHTYHPRIKRPSFRHLKLPTHTIVNTNPSLSLPYLYLFYKDQQDVGSFPKSKDEYSFEHLFSCVCNILFPLQYKSCCTDTDPNTGKNRSSTIFRYCCEFRYLSRSW